jgi:hypothetical protein
MSPAIAVRPTRLETLEKIGEAASREAADGVGDLGGVIVKSRSPVVLEQADHG